MKIKLLFAVVASIMIGLMGMPTQSAHAACISEHFMNLPAWYDGLKGDMDKVKHICSIQTPSNEEELAQYIWTIALNITSIIFGVAGYLAVLFVIYGGYQYMLSRGDPGMAAKGRQTITNAVIGIVLCASASTIAGAINGVITRAAGDESRFFASIANTAIVWAGIIAVIMIVVGGIYYTTSNGDPNKVTKAKNTIMYAVIGLVIAIVAAAIVNAALGAL